MIDALPVVSEAYAARLRRRQTSPEPDLWQLLDRVCDPEIPVLSLWDLGVLIDIERDASGVIVTITPTYSGCPAMHAMRQDIEASLRAAGVEPFEVREKLSPPWSTDWISPQGRARLVAYGIAAPKACGACDSGALELDIACPQCGSSHTRMVSEFGSTACKALFQCRACHEPFDYFKPL